MAQARSPTIAVRQLLLVDTLANQGIFLAIDLVVNVCQHLVALALLIEPVREALVVSSDHIQDQGLLFLEIALVIDIERWRMLVIVVVVQHIDVVCLIAPVDQLAFVSGYRLVVTAVVERDIQLIFIVVLQVVGDVQPLLHDLHSRGDAFLVTVQFDAVP